MRIISQAESVTTVKSFIKSCVDFSLCRMHFGFLKEFPEFVFLQTVVHG